MDIQNIATVILDGLKKKGIQGDVTIPDLMECLDDFGPEAYNQVVADAAENLLANLDPDPDATHDLETQFGHELIDLENEHPWVLDEDKAVLVIQYSDHPCAEFFHHGGGVAKDQGMQDPFPFKTFAGEALAEDVKKYLHDNHDLYSINNNTLAAVVAE